MVEFVKLVESAIELEIQGHDFYVNCSKKTKDETGKYMFEFLAQEEVGHRQKLEKEYKKHAGEDYVPVGSKQTDIFNGKGINDVSDELEALNIGVVAEKKSIQRYGDMIEKTSDQVAVSLLRDIVRDEEKHLAILEKEVEFVTQTGEYMDFKVITF